MKIITSRSLKEFGIASEHFQEEKTTRMTRITNFVEHILMSPVYEIERFETNAQFAFRSVVTGCK